MIGRRCGFTYSWNEHYECPKRTVTGTCIAHRLERLRWERRGRNRWLTVGVDLSNLNRPYVMIDECRPPRFASIQYGNGNSDPVVDVTLQVPDDVTKTAWCGLGLAGILTVMVGRRKLIAAGTRPRPSCRRRDR